MSEPLVLRTVLIHGLTYQVEIQMAGGWPTVGYRVTTNENKSFLVSGPDFDSILRFIEWGSMK